MAVYLLDLGKEIHHIQLEEISHIKVEADPLEERGYLVAVTFAGCYEASINFSFSETNDLEAKKVAEFISSWYAYYDATD